MKLLNSPIRKNLVASGLGLLIQISNQILLVPLFLLQWDINYYGDWIILTSLSLIFQMTDAGLSSVTQNQFSIEYAQEKYSVCKSLLTNNTVLITIIGIVCLTGCLVFALFFNMASILGLNIINGTEAGIVLFATTTSVFIKMEGSVYDSIYRANSQLYKATSITQINILLNTIVTVICLFVFDTMVYVALSILLVDIIVLSVRIGKTKKIFQYSFSFRSINRKLFKQLLLPSLSFMCFPLSNAIIYQGFTLLVNRFFGAEAMVAYNTIRTLTSFVKKVISMIQSSVWPEYSLAYGRNDVKRMRELHRKAFSLSFPLTIFCCVLIMTFGKYIYEIWTTGKITFDYSLSFAFCLLLIARNIWATSNVALVATNKHVRFSIYYLLGAIFSLIISVSVVRMFNFLEIFVYSQLVIDIMLCGYVLRKAMQLTDDRIGKFILSPIDLFSQYIYRRNK